MGKFPGGFSGSLYVGLLLMAFNTAQAQPIALSISVSQAAVEEGEDLPFVVNLSQSLPSTGQLRYTLSGDTDNFLDGPGGLFSVDIPPDITSFPLNIPTDDDSTDEPNGIVTLALVSFRGGGFDEGFLTGVSVTVTDNDGDNIPDFGVSTTIPAQTYTQFTAITNLTLPAAVGGDGTLVYSISPLPAGLSFNAITRTLSGTPTTLQAATDYMVTVTDADGDTDTITFSIAVAPPTPPDAPTITRQSLSPAIHRFDWNDPNDNNCAVNRFQYVLEIRVIGESFGRAIASISVPNGGSGGTALLSTIDNPLPPGGYYRFEVEAVSDGVGGCGNRSQPAVFFFDPDTVGTVEMPDQSLAAGRIMDIDVSTAAVFTGITVTTWLDLTAFYAPYAGDGRRNAPYAPRMMVKVLLYAYATGVFSSRGIARKLEEDVAFRVLGGGQLPATSDAVRVPAAALVGLQGAVCSGGSSGALREAVD